MTVKAFLENAKSASEMLLSPANNRVRVSIAKRGIPRSKPSRDGFAKSFQSPLKTAKIMTIPNAPISKTVSAKLGIPKLIPGVQFG